MEDRFKFRGQDYNGEWHCGSLYNADGVYYILNMISGTPNGDIETSYEVDIKTVGQSIGLKDKHGKLIYEGDVVKFNGAGWSCDEGETLAEVKYGLDCDRRTIGFYIDNCFRDFSYLDIEIIGNIHKGDISD